MTEPDSLNVRDGLLVLPFHDKQALYDWMLFNHETSPGIWLRMYKKASGIPTIVWAEAVEVCLCFGWIDSVANRFDEQSYLQRLTPRRKRSVWSKINRQSVGRLTEQKLMQPAGLLQVELAKADGRWDGAYDSPKNMKVPDYFITELKKNPKALAAYEELNKTSLYFIGYSLATAMKPETKIKRIDAIIEKLAKGIALT